MVLPPCCADSALLFPSNAIARARVVARHAGSLLVSLTACIGCAESADGQRRSRVSRTLFYSVASRAGDLGRLWIDIARNCSLAPAILTPPFSSGNGIERASGG